MILSERERRTLLAALRSWQNELGFHSTEELQAAYPDLGPEPLTAGEVETLIGRLTDLAAVMSEIANSAQALESATRRVVAAVRRLQPDDRR